MSGPTPSQTIGPFFHVAIAASRPTGEDDLEARAIRLRGRVLDGDGEPVTDALVEVWDVSGRLFRCPTGADGAYVVTTAKPPAPDGEAPYLGIWIFARGLLTGLLTRCYFPDEAPANAEDPVLAAVARDSPDRVSSLTAESDGDGLRFDIHLQGPQETVFFAR